MCLSYTWAIFRFHSPMLQRKRKRKKEEKCWSLRLHLRLCLRQDRFHGEIWAPTHNWTVLTSISVVWVLEVLQQGWFLGCVFFIFSLGYFWQKYIKRVFTIFQNTSSFIKIPRLVSHFQLSSCFCSTLNWRLLVYDKLHELSYFSSAVAKQLL